MSDEPLDGAGALARIADAMIGRRELALYEWHLVEGWAKSTDTHLTMFGYPAGAWEVTYENWASRVHPDDIGEADGRMHALIAGETSRYYASYRFRNAEGRWQWVQSWAYVTERDAQGAPVRVTGAMVDAQGAKVHDARLRHAQKMDLLGQVTGGIAHDFNNLLAILTGVHEALREGSAPAAEILADMADALQRGQGLTQALLAHARRERPVVTRFDLHGRLRTLTRMLRVAVGAGVTLELELPEEPIPILASTVAVDNAILNLVLNARDALDPNGTRVLVRLEERHLDEDEAGRQGLAPGAYAVVSVIDDGCGMDEEVLARATEPLFSTKGVGKGTGLGLSTIAREMAEVGGGHRIISAPGEGTTVELFLPREEGPEVSAPPPPRGARVLVVDDEPAILKSLARQLGSIGYEVETASHPREALSRLGQEPFHLLLTDVVMPATIDGIELAKRARRRHPELAIVFMSGFADQEQAAREIGVLIHKPFSTEELHRCLTEVLQRVDGAR